MAKDKKKRVVFINTRTEKRADKLLEELGYRPDGRLISELPQEQLDLEQAIETRRVTFDETRDCVFAVVC